MRLLFYAPNPLAFDMLPVLHNTARPYQIEDAKQIVKWKGRGILGHKTGLGKTFIAYLIWEMLRQPPKVLVTGTTSAVATWLRLTPQWIGINPIQVTGHYSTRNILWNRIYEMDEAWVAINHDILRRDINQIARVPWHMVIVDEAHKVRNRKSVAFKALDRLRNVPYLLLASATLASRGPQDIWGPLHLVDRKSFASFWRFINTYCYVDAGPFGQEIIGVRNASQLRDLLRKNYYVARTYEEVLPQLPPVMREVRPLEMTHIQEDMYRQLDEEMIALIRSAETEEQKLLIAPNVLAKSVRLRQILVCPKILGIPDCGAGLEYLKERIEDDPHTVIFTPFAAALPFIKQELEEVEGVKVFILQGGLKSEEVNTRIEQFKKERGVMLCTISYAQSFALDTVHTAYFLGFSWDPTENEQAEGRLRRMDSQHTQGVRVEYLMHEDTIDGDVREVLNGKTINVSRFMKDKRIPPVQSTIKVPLITS
jgi:SNF2 family DNA or RNA helicase